MKQHPKSISDYLLADPTLQKLLSREKEQQQLLKLIIELLPEKLKAHCLASVLNNNRLCLYTDSSAWASRLRFFSRDLNSRLRQAGLKIDKINVRVLINRQPSGRTVKKAVRHLSRENADLILQTSQSIADPKLSAALQRLCKHTR